MTLDSCKKKIERYLKKENVQPLIVNVNNELDLENLVSYFNIDGNFIVRASDFCKKMNFLNWKCYSQKFLLK